MKTGNNSRGRIYENKLDQIHDIQNLEAKTVDTENSHQLKNFSENFNINPNHSFLEILMAKEHKNKNLHHDYKYNISSDNLDHSDIFYKILRNRRVKKKTKSFVTNHDNNNNINSALIRFKTNIQKLKSMREKICNSISNMTNSLKTNSKISFNKKNNFKKKYNALNSIPNLKNKIIKKKKIGGASDYETLSKNNRTVILPPNEKICYNGLNKFKYINENKRIKVNNLNKNNKLYIPKKPLISIGTVQKKNLKKCITNQKSFMIPVKKPKKIDYPMNLKKKIISIHDNNIKINHNSFCKIVKDKKNLSSIDLHIKNNNIKNKNSKNNNIKNNNSKTINNKSSNSKNNSIKNNKNKSIIIKNNNKDKNLKDKSNKKIREHKHNCKSTLYNKIYDRNNNDKEIIEVQKTVFKIVDEKNKKICYRVNINSSSSKDKKKFDNEFSEIKTNPQSKVKIIKYKIPKRNYSSLYFRGLDLMKKIGDNVEKYYDNNNNKTMTNNHNQGKSFDFLDKM